MEGVHNNKSFTFKKFNIYQRGHCIFCLRKLVCNSSNEIDSFELIGNESDDLVEVSAALALSPQFLNTLNEIWPCLENNGSSSDGEKGNLLETVLKGNPPPNNSSALAQFTFAAPPEICTFCASKVQAAEDLITSLKLKISELKAIITKSMIVGQGKHLGSNLSGPTASQEKDAVHFFDALGDSPTDEQNEEESGKNGEVHVATLQNVVEYQDERRNDDPEENDNDPDYIKSEGSDDDEESLMSVDDLGAISSEGENDEDEDPLQDNQLPHNSVAPPKPKKRKLTMTKNGGSKRKGKEQCILLPCTIRGCDDLFDSVDKLQSHVNLTHTIGIFKCACGQSFRFKKDVREHQKLHLKERKSLRSTGIQVKLEICDLCGMKMTASRFVEHLEAHIGDYVLRCPNGSCFKAFSCNQSWRTHIRGFQKCRDAFKNDPKLCTCESCGFKAVDRFRLYTHLQDHHERGSEKMFTCPLDSCEKRLSVRQSIPFHLNTHSKYSLDTAFQICEHCNKKIEMEKIKDHLKDKHDAKEIIKCGQCHYLLCSKLSLVEHQRVHRHVGMYCHICSDGVKYTRHVDLREHYRTVHQVAGNEYLCEHCSETFWSKFALSDHLLAKHSTGKNEKIKKKRKRFHCDSCQVGFCVEASLIAHKIRVHGDSPFTCTLCPATFTLKHLLSRHEKEHAGIPIPQEEFICEVPACGKKFNNKAYLKSHSLSHVRNCVCEICGKSYGKSITLKKHHESVHLNLRPFICANCGEAFSTARILKTHERIHTAVRPFLCTVCGQSFRHKSVLTNHLKGHEKKGADFKPNGPMQQNRKRNGQ